MVHKCIHVGVGGRGVWPWRAFAQRQDFQAWLLADIRPDHLEHARDACGLPAAHCFGSMAEAMDSSLAGEADTVIVITPPDLHAPMCLEAVRRGMHVMVEKPFTKSLAQARLIVEEAERRGVRVFVTQNARLGAAAWTLARLTRQQVYGRPVFGLMTKAGWRPGVHHSGQDDHAYLWERGIHDFDTLRWIFAAEPRRISCLSFNPPWSPYRGGAGAHAWIEFRGGATCAYSSNFCAHAGGDALGVECERASLQVVGHQIRVVHQASKETQVLALDQVPSVEQTMLDLFCAYLEDGIEPPSSGRGNLWTVAMVEAGALSSEEGRIVDVGELLGTQA
ncbi:MAG: Gfo/Idh/MocA family oxidoreductase [Candidatus Latescibacterota bacterium]